MSSDAQARASRIDPDRELISRSRAADYEAFEKLVHKYERQVYTLGMRILQRPEDAEEVVQDTFLSVLEHLSDFREESLFHTWLIRIATNKALKGLARRRRNAAQSLDVANDDDEPLPHPHVIAHWKDDPVHIAQDHEAMRLINDALATLDEKHRTVFVLRDIEGFTTEETAELLGLTISNVKVRLLRARLALREQLTAELGDPQRRVEPAHDHG
jgi:RNA polymerase sigma-70 factor (ECF subfamily)